MPADVERYMYLPYAVEVVPDETTEGEQCYLASHPELPGCMAHGETPKEALENLEDAKGLYIRTLLGRGLAVPSPKKTVTRTTHSYGRQEVIWTPQTPPVIKAESKSQKQQLSPDAELITV